MVKLQDRLQTYWQRLRRSPDPAIPEIIEVTAEPVEEQPELSRWQKFTARFQRSQTSAMTSGNANDLEDQVEETLEEQDKTRIAQVFQKVVRRVKPEDIERVKAGLDQMRRGPVKEVWGKVQSLAKMIKDPHVAWKSKAVAIAALVYLVSPFDAVPDVIPFAGLADDVAVIAAVVSTLAVELEKYMTRQAEQKAAIEIKKQTEIVRITLIGSIVAAAIAIIVKLILNTLG
ncbi:hypothetical protein NIES208_15295 [[Limnothrix rosea] IAM M-220]|nr:hypothetical protein NIES208_15295 [[Limnothrix rosea] IAM M-220]